MTPPSESAVLAEISRIAQQELDVSRPLLPSEALQEALDLDSMRLTILAVALENRYRIRLSEEDSSRVTTVGELATLVARKASEAVPC